MGLPGKSEGVVFSPVPCEVVCYEPERVGVAFLRDAVEKPNPIQQDLEQVWQAADSLDRLLGQALSYVEKVLVRYEADTYTYMCALLELIFNLSITREIIFIRINFIVTNHKKIN